MSNLLFNNIDRKLVGWHVHPRGHKELDSELILIKKHGLKVVVRSHVPIQNGCVHRGTETGDVSLWSTPGYKTNMIGCVLFITDDSMGIARVIIAVPKSPIYSSNWLNLYISACPATQWSHHRCPVNHIHVEISVRTDCPMTVRYTETY